MSAAPRFCHSCGEALVEGGRFCGSCGTAVRSPSSAPTARRRSQPPPGPAAHGPAKPPGEASSRPSTAPPATPPAPANDNAGSAGVPVKTIVLVILLILFGLGKRYSREFGTWMEGLFGR